MNRAVSIPAAVLFGLCVAACSHKAPALAPRPSPAPAAATPAPPAPPPPAVRTRAAAAGPAALSEEELFRRLSLDELNAQKPLGDVFFDYDKNEIREEGRAVLQRDAAWLAKWPRTRISIEGHCDERGTSEYNLALGSQRAQKVREYLVGLGISGDRLEVKTLGREAPFCNGTGEACWSQNRRDHFIVMTK